MRIAILGSGQVGGALGQRLAAAGHEIVFGVRNPRSSRVQRRLAAIGPSASAVALPDAVDQAEAVILAVPFEAVDEVAARTGDLSGHLVLDATNPLDSDDLGLLVLKYDMTTSGGEQIAARLPEARVVKIFNSVGWEILADPIFDGRGASMFLAGDDKPAKQTAARIATDIGFEPIDAGPLFAARYLEPLAPLWIHLAGLPDLGRNAIAFRLLTR